MTIADLLFVLLFFGAAGVLMAALAAAVRGRRDRALSILIRLAIGTALYLAVVFGVSWATSPRILRAGDPMCNGEWCIAMEKADRSADGRSLAVDLRMFSTAKRVAMREKNVRVYLLDSAGRPFDPHPDSNELPFDLQLQPGESAVTQRVFDLPSGARHLGLVASAAEAFPVAWSLARTAGSISPTSSLSIDARQVAPGQFTS